MTREESILVDLLISQSTADSIAGRLSDGNKTIQKEAVEIILNHLALADLVTSGTIAGTLTVWKLTDSGRLKARELNPKHRDFILPNPPAIPA